MILVTGGHGQLACCLKDHFHPHEAVFLTHSDCDISNKESLSEVFEKIRPKIVVNTAAYTRVDQCENEQDQARKVNVQGAENLAILCEQSDSTLVHISTDYVFNGKKNTPYQEVDQTSPLGAYGKTKEEGEQKILKAHPKALIIRTSWLYSEYGENFVKKMSSLLLEREQLGIVMDQVGSPTYAQDLAEALCRVTRSKLIPGIYHYANLGVASWYDLTIELAKKGGSSCKILPIRSEEYPTPAERPSYSVLSTEKIRETFTLTIPHWRDSLEKCINKLRNS